MMTKTTLTPKHVLRVMYTHNDDQLHEFCSSDTGQNFCAGGFVD